MKTLKLLIIIFTALIFIYLSFSYVTLQINFLKWSLITRFISIITTAFLCFVVWLWFALGCNIR